MDPRELWQPDGRKIRVERKRLGLGRNELAHRAGISPHTLARAERSTPMFPTTVRLIALALGVSPTKIASLPSNADRWSMADERHVQIVMHIHSVYNEAAMSKDLTIIQRDIGPYLHPDIEWTSAGTEDLGYNGVFRGKAGVLNFFEKSLGIATRTQPIEWEDIRPIELNRVLAVGRDRILYEPGNFWINAKGSNMFTFEENLVIVWHQSVIFLGRDPA